MAGDVVLQVRALPDRVQLQAKIYDRSGRAFGFGTGKDAQGRLGGAFEIAPPGHPLKLKIAPMFRYPSASHLGELLSH